MEDLGGAGTTQDEEQVLAKEWHYTFSLPSGRKTACYVPDEAKNIHHTRLAMMWKVLEPEFDGRWHEVRALDIGCNQGWFSCHLAARGCAEVCGVDARAGNIRDAELVARARGHKNTRFMQAYVHELTPERVGLFDVTIMFGVAHRLENPVEAIRRARALTRNVCLIEAMVAPELGATLVWGSRDVEKTSKGVFLLIDAADESSMTTGNLTEVTLCPSASALAWLMTVAGFTRVHSVVPPPACWEQHTTGKRVMLAGYR
jgi:SAM-dependent methyltransferase